VARTLFIWFGKQYLPSLSLLIVPIAIIAIGTNTDHWILHHLIR
jgi:hypothetical protein